MNRYLHIITGSYLAATGLMGLAAHQQIPNWKSWLALHTLGSILAFGCLFLPHERLPEWAKFIVNWYPVFLFLPLYKEAEVFAHIFGDWSWTKTIQALELGLFHAHPSIFLSLKLPYLWLSEILHLCYFSYVLLIPIVGGYWYFTAKRKAFQELLLLTTTAYLVSYTIYIFYPIDSPYYLFDSLSSPLSEGWIYQLVHFTSDRGGARGGAFPSAHIAISTIVLLVAWKRQRPLGYIILPVVLGIYLATVYGRFHYVMDVIAGCVLAVIVWKGFALMGSLRGT